MANLKFDRGAKERKILKSSDAWQTDHDHETTLEFEPIHWNDFNFLHINSTHKGTDGVRRKSHFIHTFTRDEVLMLRDFLNEVLMRNAGTDEKLPAPDTNKVLMSKNA